MWTAQTVPANIAGLSDRRKKQWLDVANQALKDGKTDGEAIRLANGIVKKTLGHPTGMANKELSVEVGEKYVSLLDRQVPQGDAGYDPYGAADGQGCATCRWFLAPDSCLIVQGTIVPTGMSDYYDPMPSDQPDMQMGTMELEKPSFFQRLVEWLGPGEKDFTADERKKMAASGMAMNDGSYPIPDTAHLQKAIHAIGRGQPQSSHAAIKAHIIKRARALKAVDQLPSDWNVKEMDLPAFSVKEMPDGRLRFTTIATNNYKDFEGQYFPAAAHKEYIEWADENNGYPELWPWHCVDRLGVVDWMDFDGNFLLSSGLIDAGMETKARAWAEDPETAMSHGFFKRQVGTDITQYREFEQSVLPRWAAANPFTDFTLGAKEMALTKEKRAALAEKGYSEDEITALESRTDAFRQRLADMGVAMKDLEESEPAPDPSPAPSPEPEPAPAGVGFSLDDLRTVVREEIAAATKDLGSRLEKVEADTKSLGESEDDKFTRLWESRRGAPPASRQPATTVASKEVPADKNQWINNIPMFQHPAFQMGGMRPENGEIR